MEHILKGQSASKAEGKTAERMTGNHGDGVRPLRSWSADKLSSCHRVLLHQRLKRYGALTVLTDRVMCHSVLSTPVQSPSNSKLSQEVAEQLTSTSASS